MKCAILVGDGMADRPLDALGGRTPLQAAQTPCMDTVAREGLLGRVRTIPPGFPPGSDIANMVIMGYDPSTDYTGRGPLEAASMGIALSPGDVAFRCNLVHLSLKEARPRMVDFTAGHIRTEEAGAIIQALDAAAGDEEIRFHPGVSYRHLMVWRDGVPDVRTTPPHDITGQEIEPHLPREEGSERLLDLIRESQALLQGPSFQPLLPPESPHPPNSIWPWGQGRAPSIEPVTRRWGIRGAIITAVDLLKGLGIYAGFQVVEVPGATGYYDTDYLGKANYALQALDEGNDLVFVHVEAPDEAGHASSVDEKVRAIESFDRDVVGTFLEGMKRWDGWALMVLPDHATPITVQTHTEEPVPFAVLYSDGPKMGGDGFSEEAADRCELFIDDGKSLLGRFLKRDWE